MLGRFLAEEITTVVHKNRGAAVVDRRLVGAIATDPRIVQRGAFDEQAAAEIGTKVGADAVLLGTITEFGQELRLNLRVIRSRTAEIQVVEQATLVADAAVRKLWEELIIKPAPSQAGGLTPVQ
jgi:TolB-like protein